MHGATIGVEVDAITGDPMLKSNNGLLRPAASGAAANAAVKCETKIAADSLSIDIDGQSRP